MKMPHPHNDDAHLGNSRAAMPHVTQQTRAKLAERFLDPVRENSAMKSVSRLSQSEPLGKSFQPAPPKVWPIRHHILDVSERTRMDSLYLPIVSTGSLRLFHVWDCKGSGSVSGTPGLLSADSTSIFL